MQATFGSRLAAQFALGKRLCVGIDPHPSLLSDWGLEDSAAGAREFGLRVIESAAEHAAAVKPQVAFFERFGSAGFLALEEVLRRSRESGVLTIADAKRGDIGSTFAAYAQAWLEPGSPLEADALTVNAYQGFGVLSPAIELSRTAGKGVFVLAATSNPEATELQTARTSTHSTVAAEVLADAWRANLAAPTSDLGSVGVVLGATIDFERYGFALPEQRTAMPPVLLPGVGAQGGDVLTVTRTFGILAHGLLVNESRSLLADGPTKLAMRIRERSSELSELVESANRE